MTFTFIPEVSIVGVTVSCINAWIVYNESGPRAAIPII